MDLTYYKPVAPFEQKHLVSLKDYSEDEILRIISLALRLKAMRANNTPHHWLEGKTLAMIFAKPSARTRVSFETGMYQLGGHALCLSNSEIGLGARESMEDIARLLSRMADGIMIRTFAQSDVDTLAKYSSVPVINALTDDYHPCQALADVMTLYEHKGTLKGLKMAYVGDGNNVANSLMLICSKLGINLNIATPTGYEPDEAMVKLARSFSAEAGAEIAVMTDPAEAVSKADAIYTDVWTSMGFEEERAARLSAFEGYCVNSALMAHAKNDAVFMHCLPAHRGEEVGAEVIDGPQSVVWDEAENRLHAQKALMVLLMAGGSII